MMSSWVADNSLYLLYFTHMVIFATFYVSNFKILVLVGVVSRIIIFPGQTTAQLWMDDAVCHCWSTSVDWIKYGLTFWQYNEDFNSGSTEDRNEERGIGTFWLFGTAWHRCLISLWTPTVRVHPETFDNDFQSIQNFYFILKSKPIQLVQKGSFMENNDGLPWEFQNNYLIYWLSVGTRWLKSMKVLWRY